jgi:nicotinamidase/pyrazinamidase
MRKRTDALIVVDVQNDFCPGGDLAVLGGDEIVRPINWLMPAFSTIVLTQDWHPASHTSFAQNHPNRKPYDVVDMPYGPQVLWPEHCVQYSYGADFHPDLATSEADVVIRKGKNREIDSYSAFLENDKRTQTGLAGYLHDRGIDRVYLCGLAYDFCVGYSALDARDLGFDAVVIDSLCRGIDLNGSYQAMTSRLLQRGVVIINKLEMEVAA